MKKNFLTKISLAAALITTSSVWALTSPSTAQAASITLSWGTSSSTVSALQTNLKTLGFFNNPTVTGYYGSVTAQAVYNFQQAYALPATYMADSDTQIAISRAVVKKNLIADSYNYIGTPYVWGGSTPSGFDCSGFVYYMFNKFGVPMQRTSSSDLFNTGYPVYRSYLQPGDLVFFSANEDGAITHVGFYIGGGKFISATRSAGIFIQSLDSSYWGPRYMGARRVY